VTLAGPEAAVLWLGPPMLAFCIATKPVLLAMKWLSKTILRIWSIEAQDAVKTIYTAEELASLATQASTEGLLDPAEQARIQGALALHSRTARDAMRPWREVTTVNIDALTSELEALAARTGLSRFPVVRRLPPTNGRPTLKVEGFVHVKDALGHSGEGGRLPTDMLRRLVSVPPDRTLADLLLSMRRHGQHIVVVADGSTPLGLLTLHDVLAVIQKLPS
jgi:CBS domain containing-hemolysin-like protein